MHIESTNGEVVTLATTTSAIFKALNLGKPDAGDRQEVRGRAVAALGRAHAWVDCAARTFNIEPGPGPHARRALRVALKAMGLTETRRSLAPLAWTLAMA